MTPLRRFVIMLLGASLCCAAPAVADERPNIVVVLLDDLRYDALGCTGHPFVQTPSIDQLAREGALFEQCFVATPLCVPSRASLLTGQYAHAHGVRGGNEDYTELSRRFVTFPRLLHDAGYETAFLGKWHIGDDDGPRPGFDRWVSFRGQGEFTDPRLNIDGERVRGEGYMTDILNEFVVEFIRQRRDKPFCLVLAHKAVHAPWTPAPRHSQLYADQPIVRAASVADNRAGKPVLTRPGLEVSPNDSDANTSDVVVLNQLRSLAAVDEGIARIRQALENAGHWDNTCIIFTSDNGFFWGEHGLGGKHSAYEESLHVPLIVRYPSRVPAGSRRTELTSTVDIAPTALELAGVDVPKEMEGRSLWPLFAATKPAWRELVYAEYFYQQGQTAFFLTWQTVRGDRWKYIHYPDHPDWDELYDLQQDRLELNNLIADERAASDRQRLRAALATAVTDPP